MYVSLTNAVLNISYNWKPQGVRLKDTTRQQFQADVVMVRIGKQVIPVLYIEY